MANFVVSSFGERHPGYPDVVGSTSGHLGSLQSLTRNGLYRWQEFPGRGYESADRQFLVGHSLLVTPVLLPNVTTVDGVFPYAGGLWRDFWTHEALNVEPDVNSTVPAPLRCSPSGA
jgi:hypothetical protein